MFIKTIACTPRSNLVQLRVTTRTGGRAKRLSVKAVENDLQFLLIKQMTCTLIEQNVEKYLCCRMPIQECFR
jgi:hypothetical protein